MEEDQILQVVKGLLEMVGVAGMENLLPSDLSTGMKRSVAIARALAAQPSAVLYDEPTTMVDPLMGHLLGDLIQRLKAQLHLTSIVVTHDMRFAERLAEMEELLREDDEDVENQPNLLAVHEGISALRDVRGALKEWPGMEFGMETEQGRALLGL